MKRDEQTRHFNSFIMKMHNTMISKSNDYADVSTDVLSNFKLAAAICQSSARINCLNLIATKVARLGVLLNSDTKPNNESIRDSILDLANYAALLDMIIEDED